MVAQALGLYICIICKDQRYHDIEYIVKYSIMTTSKELT